MRVTSFIGSNRQGRNAHAVMKRHSARDLHLLEWHQGTQTDGASRSTVNTPYNRHGVHDSPCSMVVSMFRNPVPSLPEVSAFVRDDHRRVLVVDDNADLTRTTS